MTPLRTLAGVLALLCAGLAATPAASATTCEPDMPDSWVRCEAGPYVFLIGCNDIVRCYAEDEARGTGAHGGVMVYQYEVCTQLVARVEFFYLWADDRECRSTVCVWDVNPLACLPEA